MRTPTSAKQTWLTRIAEFTALSLAALAPCSAPVLAQVAVPDTHETNAPIVRRIVVSIPDHKLALIENGRVVRIYSVAVGAPESPSPSGEFQIAQRLENPTYYKPGVVIGPGGNNPLGTRWMGLNVKGFGIHGTNQPNSIGKNASHGCVRLRNEDAEDLFARVRVGDRVSLVAERDEEIAQIFGGAPALTNANASVVHSSPATESSADTQSGDK